MSDQQSSLPIGKNTPITLGMFVIVLGVSVAAIFKAGQVLTEFDYLKASIIDVRSDLRELKGTIQRLDRNTKADAEIGSNSNQRKPL